MCIGIPMQVLTTGPGRALAQGRGLCLQVDTALVGDVAAGDWLLVFIDAARECISTTRAAEVNEVLDLVESALRGDTSSAEPGFELPSASTAWQLSALCGSGGAPPGDPCP
jgi:hydrogenase expression/formation protein HypC